MYGYLLARCGRENLAQDLTGETFLAAVEAVRREPHHRLSVAWLIGVARHKLVDHWRGEARQARHLHALEDPAGELEDPWEVSWTPCGPAPRCSSSRRTTAPR